MPRHLARWITLGVLLSSSAIVLISILSHVTLSELGAFGYLTFALASLMSTAVLMVQVIRFRVITLGLSEGSRPDLRGIVSARMGSNFVSLSTPANIGGEFVRAAWLSSKGFQGGRALWIGYLEGVLDVYAGSTLAVISAIYAFLSGASVLASAIVLVALLSIGLYTSLILIPALKGVSPIPRRLVAVMKHFLGEGRASRLESTLQEGMKNFALAARVTFSRESLPMLLEIISLTIVQAILSGAALWIVLSSAGLKISLFSSMLVAYGASTIAALPVSVGGAGLTEVAVATYLSLVFGFSSWPAVVLWRIASFQFVLAITSAFFLIYIHRSTGRIVSRDHSANR